MKYTVKTKDGELSFEHLADVQKAYVLGLVEPDDEVVHDGAAVGRKASAIPLLSTAAKVSKADAHTRLTQAWFFSALALAMVAFFLLITGHYFFGILPAILATSAMMQVTVRTVKKRR